MGWIFDAMNKAGEAGGEGKGQGAGSGHGPGPGSGQSPPSGANGRPPTAAAPPTAHQPKAPDDAPRSSVVGKVNPDVAAAAAAPAGAIPFESKAPLRQVDDRLVALTSPGSVMAEEYRAIRTRLLARFEQGRNLVHCITSATPKEGKTLTALNLGLAFAEMSDRRTVVIEGDLRVPMFAKLLGLPQGPGLIQVLGKKAALERAITPTELSNLSVIAAGGEAGDDAMRLLSSHTMSQAIELLRRRFDHVIIDTPPVLELADAGILGSQSDDVMLVVRMNRTPRYMIDQAIRILNSYHAPVSGVVLTDMRPDAPRYLHRYGYHYHYRRHSYGRNREYRKSA